MKAYSLSLDIGTSSVGWAAIDQDYNILTKKMKVEGSKGKRKNFWGVNLFESAETAAERRGHRSASRRYNRRRYRIGQLNELFSDEILKIDESFFVRLTESFHSLKDETRNYHGHFLFQDKNFNDKDYYKEYPTIYHLRKALVDDKQQADLRLVYLACHHIIKYRGNFLYEDSEFSFGDEGENQTALDLILKGIQLLTQWTGEDWELSDSQKMEISDILQEKTAASNKVRELQKIITGKSNKALKELFNLVLGLKGNLPHLFGLTDLEKETRQLSFNAENSEEQLALLATVLDEDQYLYLEFLSEVYSRSQLEQILSVSQEDNSQAKLSTSMVERYSEHQQQLKELKQFVKVNYGVEKYRQIFREELKDNYTGYINGVGKDLHKKASREDFYKFLLGKNGLDSKSNGGRYAELNKIEALIASDNYLLKQRIRENGAIPYQVHLHELQSILANQSRYYPFLKEISPKLSALVSFRIPYYVGPLTDNTDMSQFAWMSKNKKIPITPWNFEEVVDRAASAESFIERMRNFDTYLLTEEVLPKASILYQRFEVLNELNKIRVNERILSVPVKQKIFNELFLVRKKVTIKQLRDFLLREGIIFDEKVTIRGTQKEDSFATSMSSYIDMKNIFGLEYVEDKKNQATIELLIKWLTLFEDKRILSEKIKSLVGITQPQIKQLVAKRYRGWGRFSKKLLDGILTQDPHKDYYQLTMIDYLWETQKNLMEAINDEKLDFKTHLENEATKHLSADIYQEIADLPGSPAIKKGIRQSVKIVEEVSEILGQAPAQIIVEMAREDGKKVRTIDRKTQLTKCYNEMKKLTSEYNSDLALSLKEVSNEELQTELLYLYFIQNGRCLYSGKSLGTIEELRKKLNGKVLEVDHILPQSYIKDDSLGNKALVYRDENQRKSADLLIDEQIIRRNRSWWKTLKDSNLMAPKTFFNLTRTEIDDNLQLNFINRQLVETRQIAKHVSHLLNAHYPDTAIVLLKANLVSEFRKKYDFIKLRNLNDYHHAQDAYLNGVVGQFLLKKYPKLNSEFILGDYQKNLQNKAQTKYKKNSASFFISRFEQKQGDQNGEIIWRPENDFERVRKNFNYRQCQIVRKTERARGSFYKATNYRKGSYNRMIPLKKGLDTSIYGGYIGEEKAYSVAISYQKGKRNIKQLFGIPIYLAESLTNELALKEYIAQELPGIKDITILSVKIFNRQLIELENSRYYLSSSQGGFTAHQLFLKEEAITHLEQVLKAIESSVTLNQQADSVYKAIYQELTSHYPKYTNIIKQVIDKEEKFSELAFELKQEVLNSLLGLASASPQRVNLEVLGLGKEVGRIEFSRGGLKFAKLKLIHLSVTGLKEKQVVL